MQITNSVVCGKSKGCICKQIKPPLVGEHAFPLMGFVCKEAHVTHAGTVRHTTCPVQAHAFLVVNHYLNA